MNICNLMENNLNMILSRFIIILIILCSSSKIVYAEVFKCLGNYSDVIEGEDYSGLSLKILSKDRIEAVYYEGSVNKIKIQNIVFDKQFIDFETIIDGYQRHFYGSCQGRTLSYKWGSTSGVLKRR